MRIFTQFSGLLTGAVLAVSLGVFSTAGASDEVVATVGGKSITMSDLEESVRTELIAVENQRFEILEGGLQILIAEQLVEREAAEREVSVEELSKVEIFDKIAEPSDAEIEQVFESNKAQLGDATLESVRDQIVDFLRSSQAQELQKAFIASLQAKYGAEIKLAPPVIEVETGSGPPRGKPDAPVTIVAFSDYECPYCKRGEQVIEQVMEHYGDSVVYYHRDYPLPFHPNAGPAAEAARCAAEQDRYWDYHTMLFVQTADGLSKERFVEIADALDLDRAKFDECIDSGRFTAVVAADMEYGASIGVQGTPAFFVNGRMLSGAQGFDRFESLIDSELARSKADAAN